MNRWRCGLVNGLIAGVVGGQLYDILTNSEHWPFSNYPMFGRPKRNGGVTTLRLHGVSKDSDQRELPWSGPEYIRPFDESRLRVGLTRLNQQPNREALLEAALRDLLGRYEERRLSRQHAGPPLRGLRLYQLGWTID